MANLSGAIGHQSSQHQEVNEGDGLKPKIISMSRKNFGTSETLSWAWSIAEIGKPCKSFSPEKFNRII